MSAFSAAGILVCACRRERASGTILEAPDLCLIDKLKDERYWEVRTSRRLSLSVDEVDREVCLEIGIAAE